MMKKETYMAPVAERIRVKNQTILAGSNAYNDTDRNIEVDYDTMGDPMDQGSARSISDYNLWND